MLTQCPISLSLTERLIGALWLLAHWAKCDPQRTKTLWNLLRLRSTSYNVVNQATDRVWCNAYGCSRNSIATREITLIFPKNGFHGGLGLDFEPILHRHGIQVPKPESEIMTKALQEGDKYLSQNQFIDNIEQERDQFRVYYQVVCRNLGLATVGEAIIDELASAYVDGCNVELYPDTTWALEHLTDIGITLGVLSDAWPSLETKFANLGIRKYFKSFTVSAKVGCYKPNEANLYKRAISEIGIETS